jgi:ribonuclease HII
MRVVDFSIERHLIQKGFKTIAGIDEAGRGALFGPVVAASVTLPSSFMTDGHPPWIRDVDDSKLLSPKKRIILARLILEQASSIGIGLATNGEIDRQNIYWASLEAMRRAVSQMNIEPEYLLVDGFQLGSVPLPQMGVPQGDRKSTTIAAASILAKVIRDEIIVFLGKVYAGYGLGQNKGYGTKEHYDALKRLGPSEFHRGSFNLGACEQK